MTDECKMLDNIQTIHKLSEKMWITLWITIITELEDRSYTHHKKDIVIMKIEHKFKYRFM